MSAKTSLSGSGVKNCEENLLACNVDERNSFLKLCKENSEVSILGKSLQISDGLNKMG